MKHSDTIMPLKEPDRIRLRPALFFASDDADGCLKMFLELFDYAIQEYQLGNANAISATKLSDGSYILEDDGCGVPIAYDPQKGIYGWEEHFCGKFPQQNSDSYTLLLGSEREHRLRSVLRCDQHFPWYVLTAGTAASRYMRATVFRDGCEYTLNFERGNIVGTVNQKRCDEHSHGTRLHFLPDDAVFSSVSFDFRRVFEYAEQQAALNPGLSITIKEFCADRVMERRYCYPDGLAGYLTAQNAQRDACHPVKRLCWDGMVDAEYAAGSIEKRAPYHVRYEIALSYTPGCAKIAFYHNYKRIANSGIHQNAVEAALSKGGNTVADRTGDISIIISTVSERTSWQTGQAMGITNPGIGKVLEAALENALANAQSDLEI